MTTAIKVENLYKKYVIGHQKQERYTALRDVIMHKLRGIGERIMHPLSPNREKIDIEEFWALKDINLEIKQGDRVGIIGRNGAGKSTLLKVLSRITEPTEGKIHLNGRVASLLEVGTGFHPELSGKENIFLNGAILGMGRSEIKQKFDEIVAFAEVEQFLDTPVKRYSSGMYVRLAFAVAAHLEPEILIVDEVLAVGDAQFQKKCLGKMEDVGKEGRTVLFVSHNMAAIQSLCTSALHLDRGKAVGYGSVMGRINSYLSMQNSIREIKSESDVRVGDCIKIERFELDSNPIKSGNQVGFILELAAERQVRIDSIVILIFSALQERVGILDLRQNQPFVVNERKLLTINGEIKSVPLVEGEYNLGLYLNFEGIQETLDRLIVLDVLGETNQVDITPYPPSVRGFMEFNTKVQVNINDKR